MMQYDNQPVIPEGCKYFKGVKNYYKAIFYKIVLC